MIVTSRPAFRSASVSSEATVASYESMTSGSSGSEYGRQGNKLGSPLSPATPPQIEHLLGTRGKEEFAQPNIMETDREGDNDAATVRSPSMRTYREGDDRGLSGLKALSSMSTSEKPRLETRLPQSGLVPGPMRVTLRDEGAVEGKKAEQSIGIQIKINDHEGSVVEASEMQAFKKTRNVSKFVEMLEADVTPAQVATWLYGSSNGRPQSKPVHLSAHDAKSRQSSNPTSRFSRPFLKIATAWSASGSIKSPTSAPNSATSPPKQRQIILGQQLPPGTGMKTSRSRSSNAESHRASPTGSATSWRRSFLGGRPASKVQPRPKSMQVVSDVRAEVEAARGYDDMEKRWIPAAREAVRRFSMSGESDDNNLSDAAPSFASSSESAFAKSGRLRRPSSMLHRVSSAQRSFTSAASSVFLPTPAEEREEFSFASAIAPSSSAATAAASKDVHVRTSSASKDGATNRRFIKLLRRISGHGWKGDNSLRRVTSPESQYGDKTGTTPESPRAYTDMARFPASFSSYGSGTEDSGCPPPLSTTINSSVRDEFAPPVMPAANSRPYSRSLSDVRDARNLKPVDEEELPLPASPGEREPEPLRPAIQERSSSLQTVV